MKIQSIDKNFMTQSESIDGLKYYTLPCVPFDLYGVFYEEKTKRFVRLDSKIAEKTSKSVGELNPLTSGGRVRFATESGKISITVKYKDKTAFPHMTSIGTSGFVLTENIGDRSKYVYSFVVGHFSNDETVRNNGFTITKTLKGGKMRYYTLYFPLYNDVEELKLGFEENAKVDSGYKYKDVLPIVYYGSSITQGGCASRPDLMYPSLIEKFTNIDFINFGFSGSALGEETIIDYISKIDCSVFVCDYDFNAPNAEYLKPSILQLYKTYRKNKKDVPIVFISNPDYYWYANGKERFNAIKNTYDYAKSQGDDKVYLIHGKDFFGKEWGICTVDGVHPNDLGFYKMAKKINKVLDGILAGKIVKKGI